MYSETRFNAHMNIMHCTLSRSMENIALGIQLRKRYILDNDKIMNYNSEYHIGYLINSIRKV